MRKLFTLLLFVGTLLVANTAFVNACSCAQPTSPQDSLKQSTAVFTGKVVKIEVPSGAEISSADPIKVTFEVSKIWKGPDSKTLVLTTSISSASCGYPFEENKEYMVYAGGEIDSLTTGLCSRTSLLSNANEDLQDLGTANLPTGSGSKFEPIPQNTNYMNVGLIGGLIVSTILIIFLVLKNKKHIS